MKPEIIVIMAAVFAIVVFYVPCVETFGLVGKTDSHYGLSVTNISIVTTNFDNKSGYTIFGLVFNPTTKSFDSVDIDGEFYDPSGELVGLQTAKVVKSVLLPGEKGAFKLEFAPINGTKIDHYILRLDEKLFHVNFGQ